MGKSFEVAEIFGDRVFDNALLKEKLSKETYKSLEKIMNSGGELSLDIAEEVASAMKDWAISRGATHFTHWFQPLTGVTAEKHVAFISAPTSKNKVVSEFSGKELVKGELDASSFPNGGLRATFEARGYTTWDCSSPAFLREDAIGTILCIPTAFCSYAGDALDLKTPLLRSMEAVNKASIRLLRALGNTSSKRVIPMAGAEQEYFLISKEKFLQRKDLVYTGRTLFGTMPAKDQDSAAHYSGSINERVGAFMKDVNDELWRSGVPAKIQHNEFAPSQHEICPIFSTANITTDQNQLIMETLKKVADRHELACLLHEKPFAEINGSGKHNNWSLVTNDGINLMSPGKSEADNLRFLLVVSCILAAVDEHADLLRVSAACVGNDYRLGGHEAPPTIISVFLGDEVERGLAEIAGGGELAGAIKNERISTGVSFLPEFSKDSSDRNRTSPFAFVGNRFEFRMVGSSDSVASANTVLNTITAEAFASAADKLEDAEDKTERIYEIIRENYVSHKRIIFDGNGYAEDWVKEAARRGLPSRESYVDAIPCLTSRKSVELFEGVGVLSRRELESRAEIRYETFVNQMRGEALAMVNITAKQLLPAVMRYTKDLSSTIISIKKASITADTSVQMKTLDKVSSLLSEAGAALEKLEDAVAGVDKCSGYAKKAAAYKNNVRPAMEALRTPLDALEKCVDKKLWPLPSYGDLLFEV